MKTKPSRHFVLIFQLVLSLRTFQTEQFMTLNESESAISTTNN